MHKLYKCMVIALLAVGMLLTVGCKNEPEAPEPNTNQVIQLPDGLEVQIGVGSRDEQDLTDDTTDTTQDSGVDGSRPEDNKPEDTKPEDNKPEDSKPEDSKPDKTPLPAPGTIDFEGYLALDPDQQEMYIESFDSLSAFNKWYNEALAEYESQIPDDTIDGPIDLDKYNP